MNKKTVLFFLSLFLLFAIGTTLKAEEKKSSSSSEEVPAGLDFTRRKNVPRLVEFTPYGGDYLGSYLNNSFVVGGSLAFRVTDRFQIGAEFNWSRIQYDLSSNFAQQGINTRNEYIGDIFMTYNIAAIERPFKKIQEIDFFTTLGIGDLNINSKNRIVGVVGGGIRIFTGVPWFALRFDTKSYIYSFPRFNNSKIAGDSTTTLGFSFLFLPRH